MMKFLRWTVEGGASIDWLTWLGHAAQSLWIMLATAWVISGNFPPAEELRPFEFLAGRVPLAAGALAAFWVFLHREASGFLKADTSRKVRDTVLDWLLGAVAAVMLMAVAWRFGFGLWLAAGVTLAWLVCALVMWKRTA